MKSHILSAILLSSAVVACGSGGGSGGAGGAGTSTGSASSTKSATTGKGVTGSGTTGSATGGAGGAAEDGTSGTPCTDNTTCDKTGNMTALCTATPLYGQMPDPASTYFPTPICIQTAACDVGNGMTINQCDNNAGVCLDTGAGQLKGVCLPLCQFDNTGAKYTGNCPGNDGCNPYGFGKDMNNAPFGVGYCFGGCLKDADCTHSGEKCDVFDGLCKATALVVPPTKAVGASCTGTTDTACNCGIAQNQTVGMCTQACKYGSADNTCPTGTMCDAGIPPTLTTPFTKVPAGVEGQCIKTCTVSTDCPTTFCYASAGETTMTCKFGPMM